MRIVFAGGGTAGHISPSIAVAEELLRLDGRTEILFIGRDGGEENEMVNRAGFSLKTVSISGFERRLTVRNIKNAFTAFKALRQAKNILNEFKPSVVFGTGGYVSYPVLKAAQNLNIKTIIHESNASLGLASRALLQGCDTVLKGFNADISVPKRVRCVSVGNPVRDDFFRKDRDAVRKRLGIGKNEILIVSFGGSGGSKALNDSMIRLMKEYSLMNASIRHIHGCGRKYYKDIARLEPILVNGRNGCIVKPYLVDIADLLSSADIAITRCGAMTLAELSASGTPSILIPSPNVTNDHQRRNAEFFVQSKAALMISENELTEDKLISTVKKLADNKKLRHELSRNISKLYIKNSRELIVQEIQKLIEQ